MSWNVMRDRGGSKAEKLSKKLCKAKEYIEDVCEEIEEMEDYFGERGDMPDEDREMMERYRSRRGRY